MKRWRSLTLLVIFTMVLTGCMGSGGSNRGDLLGEIRFRGSNELVDGALVFLDGEYTYTQQNGQFEFRGVRAGNHTIEVEHRDAVYRDTVLISEGKTLFLRGSNAITIQQTGSPTTGDIAGYVYIRTGSQLGIASSESEVMISSIASSPRGYEPLAGAGISIYKNDANVNGGFTDSNGYFYISEIWPDQYDLNVTHHALRSPITQRIQIRRNAVTWLDGGNNALRGGIGYYIIVGIDHYPNMSGETYFEGPVADAELVYDTLFVDNQLAGLGRLLTNTKARKGDIKKAIEDAVALSESSQDYLVLYFSGLSGKDYLSPSDDNGRDWSRAIVDSELEGWLRNFPGSITVIIDGSESESMADGSILKPQALKKPRYTVITAAHKGESVYYDRNLGNSVFTYFLAQGIKTESADWNRDRNITSWELFNYIEEEMYHYHGNAHVPMFQSGDSIDSIIFRYPIDR